MSEEDIRRGKVVITAVGILFYRRTGGVIEVLTAERQNEPWKGSTAVVFGGLADKDDLSVEEAAFREGNEETGGTLKFKTIHLVGIYGPVNYYHELKRRDSKLIAVATSIPISDKHFVAIVYAAEVLSGMPTKNPEMQNFRFVNPLTLADENCKFAFEDALVLSDFWYKIRHNPAWKNPELARWIYASPE